MFLTEMPSYNNAVKQYGIEGADFWAQFDFSTTKRNNKGVSYLSRIRRIF